MKPFLLLISLSFVTLTMNSQSHDTCADAFAASTITAGTYSIGAINGTDLPSSYCDNITNSNNVDFVEWLKYIPSSDYTVTISSDLIANGDKDTKVNIYTGSCGALTCVTGDDDSGVYPGTNTYSYLSYVTFNVTSGQTYYIVWDNERSGSNFDFTLSEQATVPPSTASAGSTFTSQSANISGTYDRALVDMNGDYLDDLVAISSTTIYMNLQTDVGFDNVSRTTTLADFLPGWSLAAGDYNADGYNDLLYGGSDGVTFMRSNQTGASGFDTVQYVEVSGPEDVFSQRSNFVDINNDGYLDAFVCHDTAPSISYINNGANVLVFENTNGLGDYFFGGNYASVWIDYDNDKDIDMYMAKCGGSDARKTNQLYRNNGDGTYTEVGVSSGLADIIQTWSAAWGDFDNDGDMDAYVGSSTRHDHKLMRNNGDSTFTDVTNGSGAGLANQGIENVTGDFNNDGFLDILSNGSLLTGNGDLTFSVQVGVVTGSNGSIGDANNDGFLDVFNGNLYINDTTVGNNWIKIVTVGDQSGGFSNINGIGARVEINTASGTQIRDVSSGVGFRHMSSLNTYFGIGTNATINYVKIYWPSGVIDTVNGPAINDTLVVIEGSSTLGLGDYSAEDLIIYPNPTKDVLNIGSVEIINGAFYTIFDMNGRRVVNATFNSNVIDVSKLSAGNYILRVSSGELIKTQKFIKE